MRPPREDTLPWYKQFWPWFLISLPLAAVVAGLVTLNIAIETDDGLVSDDYYKEGLAIYKDADSAAKAKALGIVANVAYDADTGAVTIRFDKPLPSDTTSVSLLVTHPTMPNRDQSIQLFPVNDTDFTGRLEPLPAAHWKLAIGPADKSWRIEGRLELPAAPATRLN